MTASGVPSVTTSGTTGMLKSFVGSWDSGNFPAVRHGVVIGVGKMKNVGARPFALLPALSIGGTHKRWER